MTLVVVNQGDSARSLLAGIEQATIAVVLINASNDVIHFNAAAEQLWGYDRSEVLGRNVDLLVPAAIRSHHDGYIAANRATGLNRIVGRSREVKIERKDGSEIWGSLSMSRVEVNGEITYMGFVRDVSDEVQRRDQVALLGMVVDKTNRAVYVAGPDARICYTNDAFTRMLGYTRDEVIGLAPEEVLVGRCTSSKTLQQLHHEIRAYGSAEREILFYDKSGNEVWVLAALNAIHDGDGHLKYLVSMMTDITESKQLQSLQNYMLQAMADDEPLRNMMRNLCSMVEQIAPDVVCSITQIDARGMLCRLGSPSLPKQHAEMMDGFVIVHDVKAADCGLLHGQPVLVEDIAADPAWQAYSAIIVSAGLMACWANPIRAKDGRVIGTLTFYYREKRGPSRWHRSIVDACTHLGALAIEREEARNEISRLAYFDALTGLPNRAHMRQLMEKAIAACPAAGSMAFMFVDLDHFKDVNDTLGHAVGDELLIAVSQQLRETIRPGDVLSRQGGDEFVVMMPNCTAEQAGRVAGRITDALAMPVRLSGHNVSVSGSVGISMYPDNARDLDSLLKYADAAMYKSKQAGRATHRFFNSEMDRANDERLAFSTALRAAICCDELKLHYQPQIHVSDGSLYGVEALARWHDPVLGEVSPARFIPLAEECGLIEQIGIWSLRTACRQMAEWRMAGLHVPCVSVNLSPLNFENAALPSVVADIIAENGLAPERLMLEVTEGVVMSEHATAIEVMRQLRAAGVGLSMDDFGTGYSSLNRLAQLPVRELKIDRSFMRDVDTEASALAIVKAVVRVGQSLNMTVVAEGIETEAQRHILAQLGCDVVQGFLYSPALPARDFEAWLSARLAERWSAIVSECRNAQSKSDGGPQAMDFMAIQAAHG